MEIKTTEAQHLTELVAKMESSSSSDEMNKVQIADLKTELAKAEDNLKIRTDELLQSKKDLRIKDEEIQQREIEISCLRGQVSDGSVNNRFRFFGFGDNLTEKNRLIAKQVNFFQIFGHFC